MKAIPRMLRTEGISILGLMIGITGASVGAEILEKAVFRRYCGTVRLKSSNRPAQIGINL